MTGRRIDVLRLRKRVESKCQRCGLMFFHWRDEDGRLCNLCSPKRVTW